MSEPQPRPDAAPASRPPSTAVLWLRLTPLHLFAIIAIAGCVIGGLWQLNSYRSQQSAAVDEVRADVTSLDDAWSLGEPFTGELLGRVVEARGEFGPRAEQVWVQGPATEGRAWLVAPLRVEGSEGALLVVRGSAAEPGPLPDVPSGPQELRLALQPSAGGGASPLTPERVTTAISVPALLNELPYRLWSGYGIATQGTSPESGLEPVAPPDPDVSWTVGLVNLAYALQWWVFALFAAFMWWRICTDQIADARARATAPTPPDEEPDP